MHRRYIERLKSKIDTILFLLEETLYRGGDLLWMGLKFCLFVLSVGRAGRPESIGAWGERRASWYLRLRGFRILQRNFRVYSGEIDLVMVDSNTLVFVEVKTTRIDNWFFGGARLSREKLKKVRRAVAAYLSRSSLKMDRWRIDGLVIEYRKIKGLPREVVNIRHYYDL